jgi:hypothetical protein
MAFVSNVSCNGEMDGSASLSTAGAYPLGTDIQFMLLPDGEFTGDSVFSGLAAGLYEAISMDVSGCSDTVQFEVEEPEVLQVLLNEVIGSEEGLAEGSIEVDVIGGTGDYTFEWTMVEDATFTSNEQNLSGLMPGTYQVLVEDSNGCTVASFPITVEGFVGIMEYDDLKLTAYPNPTADWVQLEWSSSAELSQLLVYDGQGKLVHEVPLQKFENSLFMDVSNWNSGVYFVSVVSEYHQQQIQLIKRR